MNSICGYWALDGAPTSPDVLTAMRLARVNHPDPDVERWLSDDGATAFGSAWWSPQIDLTPPRLIARHPETGCVAIADARLDEPEHLRGLLGLPMEQAPHAVDIILSAWLRWGDACPEHIDGDFAFAVRDPRNDCLFFARDRMGVRPLYIHHVPGKLLVFGSTSRTVLEHPRVPQDINEARIADFLIDGLEGVDFTSTFHLAVQRHPPRHTLRIKPESHRSHRYWQLEPNRAGPLPKSDDEWAEALTAVLETAVAQCLRGPERVGSMLSGGMDSTSLAIIGGEQLQAAGKAPLPTYSVIHSGLPECKETEAVRHLLAMPIFRPNVSDLANLREKCPALLGFPNTCEEPFDVFMPLLDVLYRSAAADGVGALLDGLDGDNLFRAGSALPRQVRHGRWPSALANVRGMAKLYGGNSFRHYLLPSLLSALMPNALRQWLLPRRMRHSHCNLLEGSLIHPVFAAQTHLQDRLERLRALRSTVLLSDPAQETAEALMHTFPTVGLERYHRVAMQHGVIPLHPLVQRKVLELGVNFPDRQRLRDGHYKPVLRHAMRGRMPDPVRLRSDKQHLGIHLNHLMWEQRFAGTHAPLSRWKPSLAKYINPKRLQCISYKEDALQAGRVSHHALYTCILDGWLPAG